MSRPYETVLIFDSSLEDSRVQEKVDRLRKIVAGDGSSAVDVVPWGKRKLAYPIDKREQGIYMILRYETDPQALAEMERVARLDEEILRHLTVVHPPESQITGAVAAQASAPAAGDGDAEGGGAEGGEGEAGAGEGGGGEAGGAEGGEGGDDE